MARRKDHSKNVYKSEHFVLKYKSLFILFSFIYLIAVLPRDFKIVFVVIFIYLLR